MRKLVFLLVVLLVLAGCAPDPVSGVQTLVAVLPQQDSGPLGGQVAALPTANAEEPTPPPSSISLPTPAPTVVGPLATMTAVAALIATPDFSATPYEIVYQGRPVFIEFQARW